MIKKYFQSYSALAFVLGLLFLMPKSFTEKLREYTARSGAVVYRGVTKKAGDPEELHSLRLENVLLSNQIQEVKEYLVSEEKIEEHFRELEWIQKEGQDVAEDKEFFIRKEQKLLDRLQRYSKSIPAQLIYREPAFWSQVFWVDVGTKDNQELGYEVVLNNSPVVIGDVIVGVVDYVGRRQSRVRMITDPSVCISVRVVRGVEQNHQLLSHLNQVIEQLKFRQDVFFSVEEQTNALEILRQLQENLQGAERDVYLAKGELNGSKTPLWRRRTEMLKGVGFNYDFADEEGPARDLRTGEAGGVQEILVHEGDLLVTTGMDGVFPAGFYVAVVDKVSPLEEGAIAYELEAKSLILNFDNLYQVTILPPVRTEVFTENQLKSF